MKTLQIIHSIEESVGSVEEGQDYRVDHIPYRGFSRGLGEFMELTIPLVSGDFEWIMIQPADNYLDYSDAVRACKESKFHHFGIGLSADSYASHGHVYRGSQLSGWREIPFFDHGMFYSKEFYKIISPCFKDSKSFWGLESLAAKLHKEKYGTTCGLYCGAEMKHTKPIQSMNWFIDGKTPSDDAAFVRQKYGI
jgi:hypothetical protein